MLILLDIDGVMVPANSWRKPEILSDGFFAFSEKSIKSLNLILDYKKSDIILTTSHKYRFSLNEWLDIFNQRNISINKISRLPENNESLNRREEILKWLENNNLSENYLILDDDKSLNSLPQKIKDNLVLTDSMIGLNSEKAEDAIDKIDRFKLEQVN